MPDGEGARRAKQVLQEIARKKPRNVSDVEKVFAAFQNARYGLEKHTELIKQVLDGVNSGKKFIDEFRKNYVPQGCFNAFVGTMLMLAKENKPDDSKAVAELRARMKNIEVKKKDLESPVPRHAVSMLQYEDSPPVAPSVDSKISYNAKLWNFHEFEMDRVNVANNNPIAVPAGSQEVLVITELLYCLMGVDGDLFQPIDTEDNMLVQFSVSAAISETHRDLAREILPLASYYSLIQSFVQYGYLPQRGQVLQALSAGVRHLLQEYMLSLAKLETMLNAGHLNLQKMIYFLRPIMRAMESLANLLQQIRRNHLRGGAVLTLLHERVAASSGNENSQRIFRDLSKQSAVPYMEMLKLWICKGVIRDPQEEFLVRQTNDSNDWEMWFEIVPSNVPEFLSKNLSKILRAGKYINAIRECKGNGRRDLEEETNFDAEEDFNEVIEAAYNFASSSLLQLIMNEYDLVGRFNSVKRYFLLQQGDFIEQFMDESEIELAKNVEKVSGLPSKLVFYSVDRFVYSVY